MTVMLVSDDANFLSTFSELALSGRLLMWSTRILILTRLPLHRLDHLRNTLAITNSMLLICSLTPNIRIVRYDVTCAIRMTQVNFVTPQLDCIRTIVPSQMTVTLGDVFSPVHVKC
ncbi:hypothetical protein Pcinc_005001 [Petrolisthes cinctipes]|uniref:Uncharacterized protein n=1 Tax=Petrolisthes cinctipes TaxID=88211 RepID=A0AAE1L0K1_PETCI|nr:hypothetical protein Pcinc_005001 [Petrolisthes cinctipes]